MKRIYLLLVVVLFLSGCSSNTRFSVDGTVKNAKSKYIYLSRLEIDVPVFIDSAKINNKGAFRFKVTANDAGFYQLGFSRVNFITLLARPGEKIKLSFSTGNLYEKYSIAGSEGSEKLRSLDITLAATKSKLDSLRTVYTKISGEPGFDVKGPVIEAEYTNTIKAQRKKNIEFIITNINSLASIKALYQRINDDTYVLYDPHDLQYLKIVSDSLTKHYPNSKEVQALTRDFQKEMSQMYSNQIEQLAKSMPQTSLNPDLKNLSGNRIMLSSLKGKYVLLTFWSVKSPDCVQENLQLKEYYKLYNKKGLEIYQINLDEKESEWRAAVGFDELPWISTREDDPANPKNAILYNVKSVPANFLYDRENKMIASNLHGRALRLKLEQLFN
jgi:thiol-disulfide isomerase/thioredoxin